MTILSNGHLWKYSEFLENKNFSFNQNKILNSLSKKDIERFEEIILTSPISNPEKFLAAQLMTGATKFEKVGRDKFSMKKTIILTGLFGIILGLIYVFLLNSIIVKREK